MTASKLKNYKEKYKTEVVKKLQEKFKYTNVMQIPKIVKIVVNIGYGEAAQNSKLMDNAVKDLTLIAAQKPVVTKARKSIASFKLRENMPIGCMVTLRGDKMYSFLERLVLVALPRARDFKGFSKKSFDGRGNLTIGVKEQIIFPEIDYDKIDKVRGLDITIVTTATSNDEGYELLKLFNIPFYN
ncbi:50S ribosomal protein L5 [Rickettsiales endosymbiont of Stachyamoeba lipophora]|uniref:50S ribosomal protein L5 n=1 Tax=Rickettsiales endosymbiont of Stachyamoeba lipophora TaxID=2486578 RepID=UPI000F655909|nr:50S ribosomal protein L5 [Rickettsiales endosymbiont of Stachyamoeba lipophora]AZL15876.1 50S ribosomal protein L5 [Rickettsiales endosymbiont of Stachyamoeba lipophora]